jgi:hypothetical protein
MLLLPLLLLLFFSPMHSSSSDPLHGRAAGKALLRLVLCTACPACHSSGSGPGSTRHQLAFTCSCCLGSSVSCL